jgi:Tfp pilus assembly protein PilO
VNGRGVWLRLWYLWVPPAVVLVLNVIWLAGLRGSVVGRGSLLTKQVTDVEVEVNKLESHARELERQTKALADLQQNLSTLRRDRLAPMRERLVPFLADLMKRTREAGLNPERLSYAARRVEKSGLVYFGASFGVKGSYEQLRRCVFLLESSPQFVLVDQLNLRSDENAASLDIGIQLAVGTYFADLDEGLMRELGVKEVTVAE